MRGLNSFTGTGFVARDAESFFLNERQGLRFTVGISRGRKKDGTEGLTDWIPCTLWGKSAELWAEWGINKGDKVLVSGRLGTSYNKEKEKNYFGINVDHFENLTSAEQRRKEKGFAEEREQPKSKGRFVGQKNEKAEEPDVESEYEMASAEEEEDSDIPF